MKWVQVQGMKLKPYVCMACGNSASGQNDPVAYFREGVDINWGDSVYLCSTCVRVLGELAGMMTPEDVEDLRRELANVSEERDELKSDNDQMSARIDRMLDGVKAKKEAAASRERKTTRGKTTKKEKANA